jgi:2-keto-4-pentenoate hydratase/2-oxohepta-3-ene-1,7-dioic acid hydratase in catechol pathway
MLLSQLPHLVPPSGITLKRIAIFGSLAVLVFAVGAFVAWVTSPDPKYNPASFEETPLVERVAQFEDAITLAQYAEDGGVVRTILVLAFGGETVTGVDLRELGATNSSNPFEALASVEALPATAEQAGAYPSIVLPMDRLLPTGSIGSRHIGTGTNFPEHAEEANSTSVFGFPKFGEATPARTTVQQQPGILLDYEVELCLRFDRDIASVEDFDAAVKGVFLCGDFTNRNAIVQLADPDNLDSGSGFSDAKSGPNFFPTGPFLVIPRDWQAFVARLRMTTSLNNDPRQDARGSEMTLNFRELVAKSLGDMSERRFLYRGGREFLAEGGMIGEDMTIMSGTSEGTIFTGPTRGDLIEAVVTYLFTGGPFVHESLLNSAKATFIKNERESSHFLKPGDTVRHGSSHLGNIEIEVTQ